MTPEQWAAEAAKMRRRHEKEENALGRLREVTTLTAPSSGSDFGEKPLR